MVPPEGLEPPRVSPLASKTSVSAISPRRLEGDNLDRLIVEGKSRR